jgi:hypothetical protein
MIISRQKNRNRRHSIYFKFDFISWRCKFLCWRSSDLYCGWVQGCESVGCSCQRMLDWSRDNSLVLNASKTQALLVSRRIRPEDVSSDVFLGGDSVPLSDVVKNLELYVDGHLSWKKQVSYVVSCTFSTLRLFYRFQRYTSRDLRIYLVRLLIVPIFLNSDVVYFPSLNGAEFRRLELAFNAWCTRYVDGLRLFDYISEFSRGIWGCTLFEIRISGTSDYLGSRLVFLVIPNPIPVTSLRGDSALYRGIRLWNVLPSAAKSSFSIGNFRREAKRFLTTVDSSKI